MKNSFVRNSFVVSRNLAFRDKAREVSRKGAEGSKSSEGSGMSFEYSHGAPSYPADVLADGNRRGYIPPEDDGTPPESQVFVVTANGSVTQCLQWSSEYADTDLALVYYNYRHYTPLDGRWTGRDPVAKPKGGNLYEYLWNTMMKNFDVLGLDVWVENTASERAKGLHRNYCKNNFGDKCK